MLQSTSRICPETYRQEAVRLKPAEVVYLCLPEFGHYAPCLAGSSRARTG